MRIALDSVGCKLNQAEIESMASQFVTAGYQLVVPSDEADVYILNTCTVTHIADRKSRHLLRLAHRRNPEACLVAIGCFAERVPEDLAQIDGVKLVLDNEQKPHLLQILEETGYLQRDMRMASQSRDSSGRRTRALVKIQDGCNNFCTYCIVPLVRRGEKSISMTQVIDEVKQRVAAGYQEVVLTGTEIGSYNDGKTGLSGLLERILAEIDIPRLRMSSLQPQGISAEFVAVWRDDRLCPHFHLSLQSGSDTALKCMKRRYSTADYQKAVSSIRQIVPEAAITTDIIVGFPGETEAGFEESYDFCRQMVFARIHVFPYSPRPGTEAALMPGKVKERVKRQRCQRMLALAEESAANFMRQFQGMILPVLWENEEGGFWSGLTGNYIRVYARSSNDLTNKLLPTKLMEVWGKGMWGLA
ncbi:tRNA (N(6)-L-threonylcarbamoyladenosine(37)-C(2))-methylthiotransferase MtaB [Chloroflexota bacterium]